MSHRMFAAVALFVAAAFYLVIIMPSDPPAIGSNYTPGTPAAPSAPGSSYTPGTPAAPSAPGSSYTPGAPASPPVIGGAPTGSFATGTVNVAVGLTSGQSVTIGGRLYQAIVPDNGAASTIFDDAQSLADAINGMRPEYPIPDVNVSATVDPDGMHVHLTAHTAGTGGNAITLAKTGAAITISGATLTGGAATPALAPPIAPTGNYTPATPAAPSAPGSSYTPPTPSNPPAIGSDYSPS